MAAWGDPIPTAKPRPWRVGDRTLGPDASGRMRPLIMGILNVTPDSFFDGGRHASLDAAVGHCETLLAQGADIIDVGGESSRPGSQPVPGDEEIRRTEPVVREIVRRFGCTVSIDTVKSGVARAALEAGALIVNDISAMTFDPLMLEVPQAFRAGVVLNHIRGRPDTMQLDPKYADVTAEVKAFLLDRVQLLAAMGVGKDRIAVDPGIGFGKRVADNHRLLEELEKLDSLGCPILVGASRKSFIAKTAGLETSDRLMPSVAAALYAALKGATVLRVHDVKATREALTLVGALREIRA